MPTKPTIVELDMGKPEDVLRRAETALNEEDYSLSKAVAESYAYLAELVGDKGYIIHCAGKCSARKRTPLRQ